MNTNHKSQMDIWEKWVWLWPTLFYATLLIAFLLTLADERLIISSGRMAMLSLVLLLWHSLGMAWAYRRLISWEQNPSRRIIVLLGDSVLWFILVNLSPAYYITLFGLFIQVFRHLPVRYATTTALILTGLVFFEQVIDSGQGLILLHPNTWLFLFAGGASILIGIWISAIIAQSRQRRDLIAQLTSTQNALMAAERREGILAERQRLARDIHDTLAQGFTSIVMHLEAAEQALPDDPALLQKHLNQARTTARHSLQKARRVVQDLRPDLLDGIQLAQAIERTAQRWQTETGIAVTVQTTGTSGPLPSDIEVTLLRATQEALSNIRKHAQATSVQITLSYMADTLMLDIQDDGVGLGGAEPARFEGGFGLQAMRERVTQCGGQLILESDPGEGTTLTLSIPVRSAVT